jgi:prevent-host-death family protein
MKTAGIVEVKAHLSMYVKQVRAGHEVLITERGEPVARLCPLADAKGITGRRRRLAAAGLLRLGRGQLCSALRSPPDGDTTAGKRVLAALLAEREEGR